MTLSHILILQYHLIYPWIESFYIIRELIERKNIHDNGYGICIILMTDYKFLTRHKLLYQYGMLTTFCGD